MSNLGQVSDFDHFFVQTASALRRLIIKPPVTALKLHLNEPVPCLRPKKWFREGKEGRDTVEFTNILFKLRILVTFQISMCVYVRIFCV